MGDSLWSLEREAKISRSFFRQSLEHCAARHRTERVIYFHSRQALAIEGEHLGSRQLWRIKAAQPFLVAEARCSDSDFGSHPEWQPSRRALRGQGGWLQG